MTFDIDGDIARIKAVEDVIPVGSDNIIDLTSPTQLEINDIEWKFSLSHVFRERAMVSASGDPIAPEDLLDTEVGYSRGEIGRWWWYVPNNTADEWLEVHARVDEAWWQLIFIGFGRALFTNGEFIETVELEPATEYSVEMVLNKETGGYSLNLLVDGVVFSSGVGTGGLFSLAVSAIGGSGMMLEEDASMPQIDFIAGTWEWIPYASPSNPATWSSGWSAGGGTKWNRQYDWDGSIEGNWFLGGDFQTGDIGTNAATASWGWTTRPWWSVCGGLNNTFAKARHAEWWMHVVPGTVPEGYKFLKIWAALATNLASGGKAFRVSQKSSPPTSMHQGEIIGGGTPAPYNGANLQMLAYIDVSDSVPGEVFYVGFACGDLAPEGQQRCGFTWPFQDGWGGTWRVNHGNQNLWNKAWVAADSTLITDFSINFHEIKIDGSVDENGRFYYEGDDEAWAGWNQEVVAVTTEEVYGAGFSTPTYLGECEIAATPVGGSVNIYTADGRLLDYGSDWEEVADDANPGGMKFRILGPDLSTGEPYEFVVVLYFVAEPTLENDETISRPSQTHEVVNQRTGPGMMKS